MQNSSVVDEAEPFEELLHEGFEVRGSERDGRMMEDTGEIVIQVLHDHVDVAYEVE